MSTSAKLEAIWLKRMKGGPMDATQQATLKKGRGLVGNANQGGKRQVTLLSKEIWNERIKELGIQADPIARRANLLISGLELANSRTRIINIGQCQIKIWGETKPCEVMDKVHPGLQESLRREWGGGAFGEVLNDGEITVGDEVSWAIDEEKNSFKEKETISPKSAVGSQRSAVGLFLNST